MSLITLLTNDQKTFYVDLDIARTSAVLNDMLNLCGNGADDGTPIFLAAVSSLALKLIIKWAEYHKNDSDSEEGRKYEEELGNGNFIPKKKLKLFSWDDCFLTDLDKMTLQELFCACNYLEVTKLRDLVSGILPQSAHCE